MNQLVHCINCHEIYFRTPFDQVPEYDWESLTSSGESLEVEKDEFQDFLKSHRGHQLEELKIIEDSFVSEKTYAEPVKISYFKATNGKENFVIKKFRERIEEPLKYQLIQGDYLLRCIDLQIQSEAIRRQLEREFYPSLPQAQVHAFLQLYQRIVKNIDVDHLERVIEESSCPLEIYSKLDDLSLMYLLRNCHSLFKGDAYSKVEAFIHRHKDDGVLLLKAIYKIEIVERRKLKRKEIGSISEEKKRIVEKA
jgi:hypothetical protein